MVSMGVADISTLAKGIRHKFIYTANEIVCNAALNKEYTIMQLNDLNFVKN